MTKQKTSNKKLKWILAATLCMALMAVPIVVKAYSGSFSFNIIAAVTGSYKHNLSSKATTVSQTARTRTYQNGYTTASKRYRVGIQRNGSIGVLSAGYVTAYSNNTTRSITYPKSSMAAGTYRVLVEKYDKVSDFIRVVGSGTIQQ